MEYELNPILNSPHVSQDVLKTAMQKLYKSTPRLDEILDAYVVYGRLTRIGSLMPFAQAIHETGWFTSRRWVENFNPAGIGATNDGAEGNKWKNPAEGIIAQYAHLLAYAVNPEAYTHQQQVLARLSPRYSILENRKMLGVAPRWIDLNGRWAWPGSTYAQRISKIANTIMQLNGNPKPLDMEPI